MLARIRKSMDEKDQGFTLIELLVVMIIIGILAAIAIPVFLNQRERAVVSSMTSDARSVATEIETYFVENQRYPATIALADADTLTIPGVAPAAATVVNLSTANRASVTTTADSYCIAVTRDAGAPSDALTVWFDSDAGGIVNAAC
ncbi:prepilin-type N-terminal cleavage/methylation domain-containing protein [Aquipuribacter hungaricus]|uniref:Type II secretion system protein n=1 Tax=Aquipuribacter hungaricus TaxID=545624 RepID=A0ABV7WDT4_9MICO